MNSLKCDGSLSAWRVKRQSLRWRERLSPLQKTRFSSWHHAQLTATCASSSDLCVHPVHTCGAGRVLSKYSDTKSLKKKKRLNYTITAQKGEVILAIH